MSGSEPRPVQSLPIAPHGHQIDTRHVTVLPPEPERGLQALEAALEPHAGVAATATRSVLADVCRRYPSLLDAWARLGQAAYAEGDFVSAYAYARVGYHRGLDRLRRHGWGGSGQVRWADATNRGFLRALHLLMLASAAIGEEDERDRCRQFLLDLDPDDGIGARSVPSLAAGERLGSQLLP